MVSTLDIKYPLRDETVIENWRPVDQTRFAGNLERQLVWRFLLGRGEASRRLAVVALPRYEGEPLVQHGALLPPSILIALAASILRHWAWTIAARAKGAPRKGWTRLNPLHRQS